MLLPIYAIAAIITIIAKTHNFNIDTSKKLPYDLRVKRELSEIGSSVNGQANDVINETSDDIYDKYNDGIASDENEDPTSIGGERDTVQDNADNIIANPLALAGSENGDEKDSDVTDDGTTKADDTPRADDDGDKVITDGGAYTNDEIDIGDSYVFIKKLLPTIFEDENIESESGEMKIMEDEDIGPRYDIIDEDLNLTEDKSAKQEITDNNEQNIKEKPTNGNHEHDSNDYNNNDNNVYNDEEESILIEAIMRNIEVGKNSKKIPENTRELTEKYQHTNDVSQEGVASDYVHSNPIFLVLFKKQNKLNTDKTSRPSIDRSDTSNFDVRKKRNTHNGYNDINDHNEHNDQTINNDSDGGTIATKVDQAFKWFKHLIHPKKEKIYITDNDSRYNGIDITTDTNPTRYQYPSTNGIYDGVDKTSAYTDDRYAPNYKDHNTNYNIHQNPHNGYDSNALAALEDTYNGYNHNGYGYNPYPNDITKYNENNDVETTTGMVVQESCIILCHSLRCPAGLRRVGGYCIRMFH